MNFAVQDETGRLQRGRKRRKHWRKLKEGVRENRKQEFNS